jgi:uncharacterized protein (DUF433 family)
MHDTNYTWKDKISINPHVCHGKPCIKGTRVLVSVILDAIASNWTNPEILKSYPTITEEDIKASLEYASDLANDWITVTLEAA